MSDEKNNEVKNDKEINILDEVKNIDRIKRRHLLMIEFENVKRLAKNILEAKEKCNVILEEVGLKEDDIKRIIDFVNSMPEVKLTEDEKKRLRENIRTDIKAKREEIAKIIQRKLPEISTDALTGVASYSAAGITTDGITSLSGDNSFTLCDANSHGIKLIF